MYTTTTTTSTAAAAKHAISLKREEEEAKYLFGWLDKFAAKKPTFGISAPMDKSKMGTSFVQFRCYQRLSECVQYIHTITKYTVY